MTNMDPNAPSESEDAPAAPRIRSSDLPNVEGDPAPPAPREINEDTPLSSLSQAEIAALTEKMLNNPETRTKLIAEITPISELRAEYLDGSQSVVRQIDWLQAHGYTQFRRAARDGNCFYRSVAFSYLDRLLHAPNIPATVARFRDVLASKEFGLTLAFQDEIYKEFSEQLYTLMQLVEDFGAALTTEDLLDRLLEVSDYVSYYFRLIASAEIRNNPEPYRDFIFDQEIVAFCQSQVEAVDSEADHIPMMALCNALRITLKLATLSSHVQGSVQEVDVFTVISPDDAMDRDLPPILLLFRPGHYDILLSPN
ncbi:OTU domain-containing protein [Mycena venus]|uniref:ubiquitinyl hydrolase 1 n=1 Tax=Mycena venus TaxID=2733690 RepID=A0A8H6XQ56_9AGAR|nr:OTU domain-containing protein [Mycena venus]